MIHVTENELVIPGQLLAENNRKGGVGTYVRNGKVYASTMGVARFVNGVIKVIPLSGRYKPQRGDKVIGIISDIKPNVVEVDISGDLTAMIKLPERGSAPLNIDIGDCVYAEVKTTGIRGIILSSEGLQKIPSGILLKVNPARVARLIGRKGSMVQMLKKESGCDFWVGRNGFVVVSGPDPASEFAAVSAINLIEREAHIPGLTERVIGLLRKIKGGKGGQA